MLKPLPFPSTSQPVPAVQTQYRRIGTPLPVPESLDLLARLHQYEPIAMQGQPPIVWDRAEGFQVHDPYGNTWIDWSSGVLVTNAGHGRQEIVDAITAQAQRHLLTNYCFPSEIRAELVERLASLMPEPLKKVFLLTTGSETIECAIKLCRTHGVRVGGKEKHVIVSFEGAFHGRTLGSQQVGGIPELKQWIGITDVSFVQVPFPDGFRNPHTTFSHFKESLERAGLRPSQVAGVILETYQGGNAAFAPVPFMQDLRAWCTEHDVLLVLDEVQAGFGRTGTLWGFEHYGVLPDLTTWGKGISSSLPIAAVAGRPDVMDLHASGSMTSTHTGNPICCAAALASLDLILGENLVENARAMGDILHDTLRGLKARYDNIGAVAGKGLVGALMCVQPGTTTPDAWLARTITWRCIEKGVLLFSPVGFGGASVKICPPLVINEAAMRESCAVLEESVAEAVAQREEELQLTA